MTVAVLPNIRRGVGRALAAIEPHYNWGSTLIDRLDAPGEGEGRFVELQWLGINLTLFYGRTPPRHTTDG
ncbi:MAG: hypothetical protein A4S16_03430 [Proteobacteria bacterium SG_bin6]|nr:MAG: hypothetical protein A4S16_03430 [Proteobacteria bacterium SG_bin6]